MLKVFITSLIGLNLHILLYNVYPSDVLVSCSTSDQMGRVKCALKIRIGTASSSGIEPMTCKIKTSIRNNVHLLKNLLSCLIFSKIVTIEQNGSEVKIYDKFKRKAT